MKLLLLRRHKESAVKNAKMHPYHVNCCKFVVFHTCNSADDIVHHRNRASDHFHHFHDEQNILDEREYTTYPSTRFDGSHFLRFLDANFAVAFEFA